MAARGSTGRPRRSCVTMDVGADEFEQSLPLLQELVLGADFVGKAPGVRPCRRSPLVAGGACGGVSLVGRAELRPSPDSRLSAGGSQRVPAKDGELPSPPEQWDGKQCLPAGPAGVQGKPSRRNGVAWVVLALAPSVFPSRSHLALLSTGQVKRVRLAPAAFTA